MPAHVPEHQTASAVLMIRPTAFASNPETRDSNAFQCEPPTDDDLTIRAQREFDAVVSALSNAGVRVHSYEGRRERDCPDEVFPNNWVSFHAGGTAVLYPMLAPSRRRERRAELLAALERDHGYRIERTIDLTAHEAHGRFLEGTGSLVLDRTNRVAYLCRSPRSDERPLAELAEHLGYVTVVLDAVDRAGTAIYHTNVLMSIGTRFAVVCLEAIPDAATRRNIAVNLERSGRDVIAITRAQLREFAANLLELRGAGGAVIALSARALASFDAAQRRALEACGSLVPVAIPSIEAFGGGSVRCMLAEIHLEH